MKLFQAFVASPSYLSRIHRLTARRATFREQLEALLRDRYGASHMLLPHYKSDPNAFVATWNDERLQRAWARESGLNERVSPKEILLAQIEAHGTEVFYNIDPVRLNNDFIKHLPGCVKRTIAWRAASSAGAAFSRHDLVVNNFPGILTSLAAEGCRTAHFSPSHDPAMDRFAANNDRPVDVVFVGGYSRHQQRRAEVLTAVAELAGRHEVVMYIDRSLLTRIAASPAGWVGPLAKLRPPRSIRENSRPPVFGLTMYEVLSQAKIVFNGHGEIAGQDRGNMRCFETMGCGGLLLTDEGRYPSSMVSGKTMVSYKNPADATSAIARLLSNDAERVDIAKEGHRMVVSNYSKEDQWARFQALVQ